MIRVSVVLGGAVLIGIALASCRPGGGGMQMGGPAKYEVIRTDDRPASELDPNLHVVLPPLDSSSASAAAASSEVPATPASGSGQPIGTSVLSGPTSSASHTHGAVPAASAAPPAASSSAKPQPKPPAKPAPPKPPPAASPTPTMPPMDHSKM